MKYSYFILTTIAAIEFGILIQKNYLDKTPFDQDDLDIAKIEGKVEALHICLDKNIQEALNHKFKKELEIFKKEEENERKKLPN